MFNKFKAIIFFNILIFSSAFANENENKSNCCDFCQSTLCPPKECAYNAPVLLTPSSCWNAYITGSFIYWKAAADYLDYAYLDNTSSSDPNSYLNIIFLGKDIEPDFEYKPGFKVGLGYKINRDNWDVFGQYTRFHQKTDSSVSSGNNQHIHAIWLNFVNFLVLGEDLGAFRKADSSWKTNFDIIDAEIGRSFFCGKYLTLRPSLGLRNLWLHQSFNLIYTSLNNSVIVTSFNKANSWGIGPRFALKNDWNIGCNFKIIGDFALAILHVNDRILISQHNPMFPIAEPHSPTDTIFSNENKLSCVKPIMDLSLGLGWGKAFFCNKSFLDLRLSYDYSVYFTQDTIKIGSTQIVPVGSGQEAIVGQGNGNQGNLTIEGFTFTARWDF